uniref:Gag-Pol polyprotein n=1 Tax=Anthurium amnicola TaxID=1678845 RepID=A0A1D1XK22_9ARAE
MGYLFRSVDPSIRLDLLELATSRAQWLYLAKRYIQSSGAREYQLRHELDTIRQGELSIQEFFTRLRRIWSELDAMHAPGRFSTCSCSSQRDRQYLYHFLMRLRPEFEALRGQLLHRSPLPSLEDALTDLLAEETRLCAIRTSVVSTETVLTAVSRSGSSQPALLPRPQSAPSYHGDSSGPSAPVYCKYCRKRGHTIDQCWTLQRRQRQPRPTVPKTAHSSSATVATAATATGSSDVTQLANRVEQIQHLLQTAGFLSEPSAMTATTGSSYRPEDWNRS